LPSQQPNSPPAGRKAPGALRRIYRANRHLFKIYLIFIITLLALFTITMIKPVYLHVIVPFNAFLADSSTLLIKALSSRSIVSDGISISSGNFSIDIAEGCNGIYALSIVLAGIIAFPARWRPKLVGLVLAVILIMILNYIRIVTLWFAGAAYPSLFETMHLYVWEFVIIALGAGFWYWWYERFIKGR
jgi:exosortase H (IPTLxxWG-CTERM-specific)